MINILDHGTEVQTRKGVTTKTPDTVEPEYQLCLLLPIVTIICETTQLPS